MRRAVKGRGRGAGGCDGDGAPALVLLLLLLMGGERDLAQFVEVERRELAGRPAAKLGAIGAVPSTLIDHPHGERAGPGGGGEHERPAGHGPPGERLDLPVQRLNADGLIVIARLPDVDDAVAIAGREQGAARLERDRGCQAGPSVVASSWLSLLQLSGRGFSGVPGSTVSLPCGKRQKWTLLSWQPDATTL